MFGKLRQQAQNISHNVTENVSHASQEVSHAVSENVQSQTQNISQPQINNPEEAMPSKGIQCYTYIGCDGVEVTYSVPKQEAKRRDRGFAQDHLEMEKKNLGTFKTSGKFEFVVRKDGQEVTRQWCEVSALTGNPDEGTMKSLADQKAVLWNDLIVCYGFYDAGSGKAGLPNRHQVFVTVTPNLSNWMDHVAPRDSPQVNRPFRSLVLPAAHDIGMNSMEIPTALVKNAGGAFVETLKGTMKMFAAVANTVSGPVVQAIAPDIICSLAVTQKDTVDTILQIGARYFEFRPAHIHSKIMPCGLDDVLYFMHGPIPGMLYDHLLHDTVGFLRAHPSEIVVIQLRWDGVPPECRRPEDNDLRIALDNALRDSGINVGNLDDLQHKSIQDLRNESKRLILFSNGNVYSTYDDAANATLNGDSIIGTFDRLDVNQMRDRALTNIQCQATATNIKDVVIHSALDSNASNSCLLATKALCDSKTLPWVRDHALERLSDRDGGLITVMNDFFDGATADVCVELSRRRLG